jgi:prevent-host-death family protein
VKNTCQPQEAKNRLSTVVENALTRGPQTITRHGTPTVVVVAANEFHQQRLRHKSIVELFEPARGLDLDVKSDKSATRNNHL